MKRFALQLAGLLLVVATLATLAVVPATAEPKVVANGGATFSVGVGRGQLIHLDQPINSIFVADPDIADATVKSPTLVYLFGKAGGSTTLFAVGDNDEVVLNATVRVNYDLAGVEQSIHKLVPKSAVSVRSLNDSVVLDGTVHSAAEADDIRRIAAKYVPDPSQVVNKIQVDAPNQVMLRVRMAEVSKSIVKEFGINWDAALQSGNFAFGLATGHPTLNFVPLQGTSPLGAFITRSLVPGATSADTVNSIGAGVNTHGSNLDVVIDALDKAGLITVLAQPNLTALSGESASFLAGGEFPVPVPQAGTGNATTITIQFKKFGVSLEFVATIAENDRINIHVQPEVSQLSTQGAIEISGIQVPALTVRRADTTIDVGSGQSFAIAGLLENSVNQTTAKFPWLGDIPILGQLFRSEAFLRNETELVVIVTPYIVRPVSNPNQLRAPTDAYVPPTDKDLVIYGEDFKPQVVHKGAAPIGSSGNGLIGPVGFELE